MEVFDRSLTHIPIEMHTKYLSNFHIKYISNSDQFVSSGYRYNGYFSAAIAISAAICKNGSSDMHSAT
jgi:hypothetical protein